MFDSLGFGADGSDYIKRHDRRLRLGAGVQRLDLRPDQQLDQLPDVAGHLLVLLDELLDVLRRSTSLGYYLYSGDVPFASPSTRR